jgi:hypothetical protein
VTDRLFFRRLARAPLHDDDDSTLKSSNFHGKQVRSRDVRAAAVVNTDVVAAGAPLGRKLRVAVVGGGPAGACAAETLANGGLRDVPDRAQDGQLQALRRRHPPVHGWRVRPPRGDHRPQGYEDEDDLARPTARWTSARP